MTRLYIHSARFVFQARIVLMAWCQYGHKLDQVMTIFLFEGKVCPLPDRYYLYLILLDSNYILYI